MGSVAMLDTFKGAVAKQMGLTVNYDSLSIPGKAIYFFTKNVLKHVFIKSKFIGHRPVNVGFLFHLIGQVKPV